MKNIITIMKKELDRVFTDKRLMFMTLVLPGVLLYVIYTFMGNAITDLESDIEEHTGIIYVENAPNSFVSFISSFDELNIDVNYVSDETYSDIESGILNGTIDVYVVFDEDFNAVLEGYATNDEIPNINTYYNDGEEYSTAVYYTVSSIISTYSTYIVSERMENPSDIIPFSVDLNNEDQLISKDNKVLGNILSMLLPFLTLTFLFSAAMSLGPDSIAGEKERNTFATLLITPIKRSEIAIGKIIGLSVLALISACSSFIGVLLSIPKLLESSDADNINIYGVSDYVMLLGVLFVTVLVIIAIVSILSSFAKTVKEASMMITPVYVLSMFAGISTMYSTDAPSNLFLYMIPIYNSAQVMSSIFSFELINAAYFITILSNIVYVLLLGFLLNKTFKSEKIMFAK